MTQRQFTIVAIIWHLAITGTVIGLAYATSTAPAPHAPIPKYLPQGRQ